MQHYQGHLMTWLCCECDQVIDYIYGGNLVQAPLWFPILNAHMQHRHLFYRHQMLRVPWQWYRAPMVKL